MSITDRLLLPAAAAGGDVTSYRPTGWPWNTLIDQANATAWTNWINTQISSDYPNCIDVTDVLDDCIYRDCHSSHRYGSVVVAINPARNFTFDITYEKTYHYIWHNSWCNVNVTELTIDQFCKGLLFLPTAGAGGGVSDVFAVSVKVGNKVIASYESGVGFANDSNKPTTGSGAGSFGANGKTYKFYTG